MNQQPDNNDGNFFPSSNVVSDSEEEEGEEDAQEEQEQEQEQESESESESDCEPVPPELQMSPREESWVWNLMKWMEGEDPECISKNKQAGGRVPSDYEYAIHAIVARGNKEKADQKIRAMQRFRLKYNIQDTVEEGVKAFQDFIQLQPGFLLHIDTLEGSQGSLLVQDFGKFFPSRFDRTSPESLRLYMVFFYYVFQICCATNLDVLRGGNRLLTEASRISRWNLDVGLQQQLFDELHLHVPLRSNEIRLYNNPPLVTSFINLIKRYMSDELLDSLQMGCQVEAVNQINEEGSGSSSSSLNQILNAIGPNNRPKLTLPQVFLQPNYEVAMDNLIIKVRTLLEERYRNEETFEMFSQAHDT